MRKKKRESLASPALKNAWAEFYASTVGQDPAELEAQGWKTIAQMVEETGHSLTGLTSRLKVLIRQKKFERSSAQIATPKGVREVAIYRPVKIKQGNNGQQCCK